MLKKLKATAFFFFFMNLSLCSRELLPRTQLNEVELAPGTADNSYIGGPLTNDSRCCFLGWIVGTLALSTLCLAVGESLVLQLTRTKRAMVWDVEREVTRTHQDSLKVNLKNVRPIYCH